MPPETSTTARRGSARPIVIVGSWRAGGRRQVLQRGARALLDLGAGGRGDRRLQGTPRGAVVLERNLAIGDPQLRFRCLGAVRVLPQQRLERGQCRLVVLGDLVRAAEPVIRVRNQRALRILVDEGAEAARRVDIIAIAQ
jgi:hypothetical protein